MSARPVTDDWFLKLKSDLESGKKVIPVRHPGGTYKFDSKSGLKQVKGKSKEQVEALLVKKIEEDKKKRRA